MTHASDQATFAAALLDPALPCPVGLKTWNASDPARRLAVYRNNVVSSLIDALADTFPVVQALVGVEFFRAMASVFVRHSPPSSRLLSQYGRTFPDFIADFEPARGVAYLADMARLEFARVSAYHAADADTVSHESIALALGNSPERLGELHLSLHPSVSVVESAFAIVSLWAAHQGDDADIGAVDPAVAEDALVLRDGLDVLVLRLPAGAARFVRAIECCRGFADAASDAGNATPEFDLAAALALLLGHGAVIAIQLPRRLDS